MGWGRGDIFVGRILVGIGVNVVIQYGVLWELLVIWWRFLKSVYVLVLIYIEAFASSEAAVVERIDFFMEFSGGGDGSDPHRRKKRYHRHTAHQIQRLESYAVFSLYIRNRTPCTKTMITIKLIKNFLSGPQKKCCFSLLAHRSFLELGLLLRFFLRDLCVQNVQRLSPSR